MEFVEQITVDLHVVVENGMTSLQALSRAG